MKFRVSGCYVYEDTGEKEKDRVVMIATANGNAFPGPCMGIETEHLYNSVPEGLIDLAIENAMVT